MKTLFRNGRPVCWTGSDESRPGCAGCRYSVTSGGREELCRRRHDRMNSPRYQRRIRVREDYRRLHAQQPRRPVNDIAEELAARYFPMSYAVVCQTIYQERRRESRDCENANGHGRSS